MRFEHDVIISNQRMEIDRLKRDLLLAGWPRGGPWRIAGQSDDGSTVDIKDDRHTVCIGLPKGKAELLVAEHNAALSAPPSPEQAGEAERYREALEEIQRCLDHLYSDRTNVGGRLPADLHKYAGPLSIISRVTFEALAQPSRGVEGEPGYPVPLPPTPPPAEVFTVGREERPLPLQRDEYADDIPYIPPLTSTPATVEITDVREGRPLPPDDEGQEAEAVSRADIVVALTELLDADDALMVVRNGPQPEIWTDATTTKKLYAELQVALSRWDLAWQGARNLLGRPTPVVTNAPHWCKEPEGQTVSPEYDHEVIAETTITLPDLPDER